MGGEIYAKGCLSLLWLRCSARAEWRLIIPFIQGSGEILWPPSASANLLSASRFFIGCQ